MFNSIKELNLCTKLKKYFVGIKKIKLNFHSRPVRMIKNFTAFTVNFLGILQKKLKTLLFITIFITLKKKRNHFNCANGIIKKIF